MEFCETKNFIRPEGRGVELSEPHLKKKKYCARCRVSFWWLVFFSPRKSNSIFCFVRRRGISSGARSHEIKLKIHAVITYFSIPIKTNSTKIFRRFPSSSPSPSHYFLDKSPSKVNFWVEHLHGILRNKKSYPSRRTWGRIVCEPYHENGFRLRKTFKDV